MARRALFGRLNWANQTGVVITATTGTVNVTLDNLKTIRPQEVCEVVPSANVSVIRVNLGTQRRIGAISYSQLRVNNDATIRCNVTTNGSSSVFDTGTVSAWPVDATNPWSVPSPGTTYNAELMAALGYTRVFVPNAAVTGGFIDTTLTTPTNALVQVGVIAVWEPWEPPLSIDWGWRLDVADESDITDVPYGSTYIIERGLRRVMSFGFQAMPQTETFARQLDYTLVVGRRRPILVLPFPDAGNDLEKSAIYGIVNNNSQLSNPFFARYAQTFQVKQLI